VQLTPQPRLAVLQVVCRLARSVKALERQTTFRQWLAATPPVPDSGPGLDTRPDME